MSKQLPALPLGLLCVHPKGGISLAVRQLAMPYGCFSAR